MVLQPVVTSYCQPCQGQVTSVPSVSRSPRGPPRWRQVLSMAWNAPPTLKSAICLPPASTHVPVPGGTSATAATFTKFAMRRLLARAPGTGQAARAFSDAVRVVEERLASSMRPRSPAQRGAELARQQLDGAARAAGLLLAPLALGLEAAVADQEPPRLYRLPDGVRVEGVSTAGADRLQHAGHHAQEGAQRHAGLDAVLAAHPGAREDGRDLLEVVQEEALRRVAEAVRLPAAEGVERGEDALQLLGKRRLCYPPVPDTEELDLAVERRVRVLVERADDVVARGELLVGVEAPPGQADQVRRVQLRVLGVDGDEQLHHLVRRQAVEDHRRYLHVLGLPGGDQLVERQQAVLAVEGAQHALLGGDLEHAEHAVRAGGGELEAPVRDQQDGARDGGQVPGLGALRVVVDQLGDLLLDDRALVGFGARRRALLEQLPVDARGLLRLALRPRRRVRADVVGEHLEAHQPVDVTRAQDGLVEEDAELVEPDGRDGDHAVRLLSTTSAAGTPAAAHPRRAPRRRWPPACRPAARGGARPPRTPARRWSGACPPAGSPPSGDPGRRQDAPAAPSPPRRAPRSGARAARARSPAGRRRSCWATPG